MSDYQSGIIGQYNSEPIQILGETQKVHSTNYCISLSQLPSEYHRVKIDGYSEVFDNEAIGTTKFKVDYDHAKVYFNPIKAGTNITVKEYWGLGIELITSDRIVTQIGDYGQAISTMSSDIEVINQMKDDYYNGTHFEVMSSEQGVYTATYSGISYFQIPVGIWNPLIDVMDVIYREITLVRDTHYSIDGGQIVLLGWTLSIGDKVFLNVKKGINTTVPVTADGSQLMNGSVAQAKLAQDIQDKMLSNFPNVSPIEPSYHTSGRIWIDTNAQVSNIDNSLPSGAYTTLTLLQTAFPTGNTNIYVVLADGHWYFWNGTAWTSGGVYQSTDNHLHDTLTSDIATGEALHTNLTSDVSTLGVLITSTEQAKDEAIVATNNATTSVSQANTARDYANTKGDYALAQGNYANNRGLYADEKGTYAKQQGDYALAQKDLALTATTNANTATANANSATTSANTATSNANTATTNANTATNNINNNTLMIYKPSVATYSAIASTYPSAVLGFVVQCVDTMIRWRYNGTSWISLGMYVDNTSIVISATQPSNPSINPVWYLQI